MWSPLSRRTARSTSRPRARTAASRGGSRRGPGRLDEVVYLTGSPGRRGWYANLKAEPSFTVHLKRGVQADLPARARLIEDPAERRDVLTRLIVGSGYDVEAWIAGSPLVEVALSDPSL